jgi:hypothetical protein
VSSWRSSCASRASRVAFLLLPACTGIIPGVTPHDIRFDASSQERDRCDPTPVDPRIYGADVIQSVEPFYRYVVGGPNGREAHLAGAKLELRPLAGITAELLERGLLCRSAQAMLGHVTALPNEPYSLPDSWVKIDVKSGRGTFEVTLAAEDATRAGEVLERAKAFAGK